MVQNTKIFDGKLFFFHMAFENKLKAQAAAKVFRAQRWEVRVIKLKEPLHNALYRISLPYGMYLREKK